MKLSVGKAFVEHAVLCPAPRRSHRFALCLALCLALCGIALSRSYAVTSYKISLADPERHLVQVKVILPEGPSERELQLPVWNALYQIRDFSQYVNWIRAEDRTGRPLTVRLLNESRWEIAGTQQGAIVEYEVFADSPGPFGTQLNTHHAFFNLAEILMYPAEARNQPMLVSFDQLPASWHIATPLSSDADGRYSAETYDRLVDSPVEIGTFQESDFDESGARYRVIIDAERGDYDAETIDTMLHKIVVAATAWMNDRPFSSYVFFYHFPHGPAGGGMEHAYSTAISLNADALARDPEMLASVTSHEFFHLWNVKRIRPQTLEPVDYTKENFTRALWFSEGCTSTAADFIQLRAGLVDERHFEQELAADIGELERRPAHLTQSAEQSSLDAWLEGYPYYRRPERSISYYNKGELLGIALDLELRAASHGKASLREVFQWMNLNYAEKNRFFPDSDGVREAAEAVSHADLRSFFQNYVVGTEEIPWDDFFRIVGLHVLQTSNTIPDAGFAASRSFDAPMIVTAITPGGPAELAGLQIGDTILEINGGAPGQDAAESVSVLSPSDTMIVKVLSRREGQRELKWKIGSREEISFDLKDLDKVTSAQRSARAAWLKGEAQNSTAR